MFAAIYSLTALIIAIYILSVVTDAIFIRSLDKISEKWKLPHSVAGASLMAMGSSAPELSIALFALFKEGGAHSDMGIGTIVGSAVFNILVITGVSAVIREARITLMAIARDTVFYLLSIVLLVAVFRDGKIVMMEALVFIVLYAIYLAFLFFVRIEDTPEGVEVPHSVEEETEEETTDEETGGAFRQLNRRLLTVLKWLAGDAERNYIRAFCVSILLITGLSWILVDMAIVFAGAIGLPPVIVALTVLAGGTSAPDLISSAVVAKQGRGNMAIANAIGSNIFDILVGLGAPWLIVLTFMGKTEVLVGTGDLLLSVFILMSTVILLFYFLCNDRILSRKEGWALLGCYVGYVVWTVMAG